MPRPSWDEYFMDITVRVAQRATCLRRKVGAILVKEKKILTTGYNGAPAGLAHCEQVGCLRDRLSVPRGERHELCRGTHAEQNAIIQAASFGVSIRGATLYSTHFPCVLCTKMLINAGVRRVVYLEGYPDDLAKEIIGEAGLEVCRTHLRPSAQSGAAPEADAALQAGPEPRKQDGRQDTESETRTESSKGRHR
jgi:dCMP deaminase